MISRAVEPLASGWRTPPPRPRGGITCRTTSTTCAAARSRSPASRSGVSADGEIYGPERQRAWHVEPQALLHAPPVRPADGRYAAAGQNQPRRTASTPAWNRVSAPSSVRTSAIRRRTVRRLMPERPGDLLVLGAGGELLQQEPPHVGARLAAVERGDRRRPLPHQLEPAGSAPRPGPAGAPATGARRRSRAARAAPRGWCR